MRDDPIRAALRGLPSEKASDGFTERVLQRAKGATGSPPHPRSARLALATLLVLAVGAPLALRAWQGQRRAEEERHRLASLRTEYRQLQEELAALHRLADRSEPVVYLGGDERVDVVLDLRTLAEHASVRRRPSREPSAPARPVD